MEEKEREHESDDAPIPVLAIPTGGIGDISDAYGMSIMPPETQQDVPDNQTRQQLEMWAYDATFEIVASQGTTFTAAVRLRGEPIGTLEAEIRDGSSGSVICRVRPDAEMVRSGYADQLTTFCHVPDWLQVRFDSGHTLANGSIYAMRHRDVPFTNWRFVDFSGFDVTKEKPMLPGSPSAGGGKTANTRSFAPGEIGRQDSLFCWTLKNWAFVGGESALGWLACDDGAGEIADFIHLADQATPPALSLVAIKASSSASVDRGLSASAYEVVGNQAVKNLRYLDTTFISTDMYTPRRLVGSSVWHNGQRVKEDSPRDLMARALAEIGPRYGRHVVIIQPQVTASEYNRARDEQSRNLNSVRVKRLRQLDTLLLSLEGSCRRLSADLTVIADAG